MPTSNYTKLFIVTESIAKKRSEIEDELAIIAGRFKSTDGPNKSQPQHNDMDTIGTDGIGNNQRSITDAKSNSNKDEQPTSAAKHDRRTLPEEDEDDNDSSYHNSPTVDDADDDAQNDECIVMAPDISIIKVEGEIFGVRARILIETFLFCCSIHCFMSE